MEIAQQRNTPPKNHKKVYLIISISLAMVLLVASIVFAYDVRQTLTGDKIYNNVCVGDTNLGGMSTMEATAAIDEGFLRYIQDKSVTITYGDKSHTLYITSMGPKTDPKLLAEKAMEFGRDGNTFKRYFQVKKLNSGAVENIPVAIELDEKLLYAEVASFGSTLLEDEGIVTFDYEKSEVTIDTDKATKTVDTDKAIKSIIATVDKGEFDPVEITFTDMPDNDDRAELLYNLIAHDPIDAQMTYEDNKLDFTEDIDGVAIDRNALVGAVSKGGVVTLPFTPVPAKISLAELKKSAFSAILASHTTYFNSGVIGRTKNIHKAAEKINGHIMMPGDEFSYNRVVGKRTIEAGFDYANAYMGNKVVQEVGGGICQVSTTLYVAVLYSDLKVTKRYNHNLPVSYVPGGMDATVSYGTLDLCFVNDTNKPIMINADVSGGAITVSVNGFERDESKKVEIYTKTVGTKAFEEELIEDSSVKSPVVKQNGVNGSTVETYKVVYINGEEKSRRRIHTSTYQPENKIVHVPPAQKEIPGVQDTPVELIPPETPSTETVEPIPQQDLLV
ncbi:MAG: VanW family protein [Eubacteriales bacterium]|nr:VanW family protein [Eubacteriales bacterium]